MRIRGRLAGAAACAALMTLSLTGCYTLNRHDIFELAFHPVSPAVLSDLSDPNHKLVTLPVSVGGRIVSAYRDRGADSKGTLLFFCGNGYGAEIALRRLLVPARALKLDLLVFNYQDEGQPVPSMADMRATAHALYAAAAADPGPAGRTIYVGGHSLGATFALDVAAHDPVAAAFVAAPVSTGVQMVHHQMPYTRLIALRQDRDYAQLDNLVIARTVRRPVIVFGSRGDTDLPPAFTHAVFSALPAGVRKKEVILGDAKHSEYLARPEFWQAVSQFFELRLHGNPVGYISPRPR